MGLAIRSANGQNEPFLACDACGQLIEQSQSAIAAFDLFSDETIKPVHIYHKVTCDPGRTGSREESASGWDLLERYFAHLLWNQGLGTKKRTKTGDKVTLDVPESLF